VSRTAEIKALIAASSIGVAPRLVKLIIAGSRDLAVSTDMIHDEVDRMLAEHNVIPCELVSGCARGPDRAGENWAGGLEMTITRFPITPSDWRSYGKSAGPMRNCEMAKYADALLAFWDGQSRGTADMIQQMLDRGKPVRVVTVRSAGYIKSVLTCNRCGERDCAVGRGMCESCFVARTGP
jgi:hypothetical protein